MWSLGLPRTSLSGDTSMITAGERRWRAAAESPHKDLSAPDTVAPSTKGSHVHSITD